MLFTTDSLLFRDEQSQRINIYYSSNRVKLEGFGGRQSVINCYFHDIYFHENKCHYCNTSILDIRSLLNAGIINGRLVRDGGLRGSNFVVDRRNPFRVYEERNCVPSCYYCNKDKSNTFDYKNLCKNNWTSKKTRVGFTFT